MGRGTGSRTTKPVWLSGSTDSSRTCHGPKPWRSSRSNGPTGSSTRGFWRAWLEVNRETLAWPAEKVARRRGLYGDDDRRPRPWRHFVGLLDRRPVSASRVLIADDVAMVHGVSTVPDARRRGIGSAVTVAALVAAREAGCRIGVLQASSMGQGPYRRLGFQYVAPYGRYVRDAATPFDRDESAGGASEDAESAAA